MTAIDVGPIAAAGAAHVGGWSAVFFQLAGRLAELNARVEAMSEADRYTIDRELREINAAVAEPDKVKFGVVGGLVERLLERIERLRATRREAAARERYEAVPATLELLADLGKATTGFNRAGAEQLLRRALDARVAAAAGDEAIVEHLYKHLRDSHFPLNRTSEHEHDAKSARHALAELGHLPFKLAGGGAFGDAPPVDLTSPVVVTDRALEFGRRAPGPTLPTKPGPRHSEWSVATKQRKAAIKWTSSSGQTKAEQLKAVEVAESADEEFRQAGSRIERLEADDRAAWHKYCTTELERRDRSLARVLAQPGLPALAIFAGEQVRLHLRAARTSVDFDVALECLLGYVELQPPEPA